MDSTDQLLKVVCVCHERWSESDLQIGKILGNCIKMLIILVLANLFDIYIYILYIHISFEMLCSIYSVPICEKLTMFDLFVELM